MSDSEDLRPLDEAERADLRARILAAADSDLDLSLREWIAYSLMGIIRPDADVDELAQQVRRERGADRPEGPAYAQAILDGIAWARGQWPAPMSGQERVGRPHMWEFEREEQLARETIRQDSFNGYAAGVEATLKWLRAVTDARPWLSAPRCSGMIAMYRGDAERCIENAILDAGDAFPVRGREVPFAEPGQFDGRFGGHEQRGSPPSSARATSNSTPTSPS